MTKDELGWLRLHLTPGLGRAGLLRLQEAFGSPGEILDAGPSAWRDRAGIRPAVASALPKEDAPLFVEAAERLRRLAVRIIPLGDETRYPSLLRKIHDPPALLYLRGTLPPGDALAVVGARRASPAGQRLTFELCRELASRGIAVVSGLARGIDTAAHQGALAGGGPTVGVLGCGIDRIYPPENADLFNRVAAEGAVISEYPPDTPPLPGHFPGRNRIISGLCRGVLVVEAALGSGSLITVDFALEQGREVFAVPGPVYAPASEGVNRLLKEGAHLVTEVGDILEVLWPALPSAAARTREDAFAATLSGKPLELYRNLEEIPLHIDDLARKSALTPMEVSAILLHLELQGGVEQLPGARFIRNRRP
ncbi:DNA protecting protein DprA [Desulfuromonas soudanensis]|uniref:DNA protecting protein DprA n=1 Tax=Desulfuromonas soudanensis TaxID=1603606 RepID=A0A0M5IKK0_9BACT|nr:DNA-processing protein DprA [Desulfuromonas soudanensis]ALC15518.1 DNA protecting protein DprA [Desulfuromonas soudanensis]